MYKVVCHLQTSGELYASQFRSYPELPRSSKRGPSGEPCGTNALESLMNLKAFY